MDRKSKLNDMADVLLNDDEEDEVRPGDVGGATCACRHEGRRVADDGNLGSTIVRWTCTRDGIGWERHTE
eukprot:scaffold412_cov311-Pavlova_lutheri.AAC.10